MGLRTGSVTGSISFGGIASGLPSNDIIDQLLQLERRPIELLEGQKEDFEAKLSILQDLSAKTLAFRDALRGLDNLTDVRLSSTASVTEEFTKFKATSSDTTVLTATAGSGAVGGSVTVRVDRLALKEREVSQAAAYANLTDTVGTGNFRIQVGSDTAVDITIDSSNNTLEGFVSAINDSDAHVRAYIMNDGASSPYRIVIEADDANEAIDVATGTTLSGGTATPSFSETQSATDAQIVIDPGGNEVTVNSNSNIFSDVIKGVTFEAKAADADTITVTVDEDIDTMVTAISNLVSAYNAIATIINEQAEVDPNTNRGGPLIGDSTLVSLKRQLSTVLASEIGSGTITSAVEIGIELDSDGKLSLDETKLRSNLSTNFSDVKSFFAGSGGFADELRRVGDTFIDPVDGMLIARIEGVNKSIAELADSISDAEERLEETEADLIQQFSALERIISDIQMQSSFLAQFVLSMQG